MNIKSTFLFLIILLISCKNETEKKINNSNKQIEKHKKESVIKVDTLYKLLENAKSKDTLEFSNQEPFLFIKSGNLFSKNEKSTIIVNCPTDSTYRIELYSLINKVWKKTDELNNLEVPYKQYEILFRDYNFDNFKDIYLNSTSSNGISMSKGHLLIVNSLTKKFENHIETKNLKNMFPDKKTKSVLIDSVDYNVNGKRVWNLIYKWKNGKLINTNQKIKTEQVY
jgi:hypothetical protein